MPVYLSPALETFLPRMCCPTCGGPLTSGHDALRCARRHTFDIARHGYVSLLTGTRATSGDDASMVRARREFLAAHRYVPIRDVVTELATEFAPVSANEPSEDAVVDVGCGTGYYLAGALDALPRAVGLGLDTSAHALRAAAKAHPRAAAATWDVFRPFPIASQQVGVVLDVFAPRNPAEFHRVLCPGGLLLVARPAGGHLAELRRQLPQMVAIDPDKERRLHQALNPYFEAVRTQQVEYTTALTTQQAMDLVFMTPSARHVDAELMTDEIGLPDHVSISVLVTAYRRR